MIYIAVPYYHEDVNVCQFRYEVVTELCARMMSKGFVPFSPITKCHELKKQGRLENWESNWWHYDVSFLRRSEAMYLLLIEGWENSQGVKAESMFCAQVGIPVVKYKVNVGATDADNKYYLADPQWASVAPEVW